MIAASNTSTASSGARMAEEVVAPVEQVFLGRVQVRGALECFRRGDQVAGALLDITLKIAEHAFADGADVRGDQLGGELPRLVQLSVFEQRPHAVHRVGRLNGGGMEGAVQRSGGRFRARACWSKREEKQAAAKERYLHVPDRTTVLPDPYQ